MVWVLFLLFLATFLFEIIKQPLQVFVIQTSYSPVELLFCFMNFISKVVLTWNLWKRVLMGRVVFKRLVLALAKSHCPLGLSLNSYFSLPTKYRHFPEVSLCLSPFSQFSSYPLIHVLC